MITSVAKKILLVFTVFTFIFLISYGLFIGLYNYTSTPKFCSSCHYVAPYVTSWSASPHKEVNCMGCHEPTGSLGKLHSKARGLNYYISDKTGNYVLPIINAAYINNRGCFGCHTDQLDNFLNAPTIINSEMHLEFINDDIKCSSCHSDVGHETKIGLDELLGR